MKRVKLLEIAIILLASAFIDTEGLGEEPPVPQTMKPKEHGMFSLPSSKSDLQKILDRCNDLNTDLSLLLRELDQTRVSTKGEAEAICILLKGLPAETTIGRAFSSRLNALTSLFQDVDTKAAFKVLATKGIPELCRIFDRLADNKDENTADDLLFVLKILAMYRTEAGTDRIISAAKKPLKPESYMWHVILAQYKDEHPHAPRLFKELSNPLPTKFLAVALLDCANDMAIAGTKIEHPFNSPEGVKRLQTWLLSKEEDEYSYAHSATAALPFIDNAELTQLFA